MKTYGCALAFVIGASLAGSPVVAEGMKGRAEPVEDSAADASDLSKDDVIGMKIVDPDGMAVGTVKGVRTGSGGEADELLVALGDKDVLLPASEVKLASNNQLRTSRSARDVKRMPSADSEKYGGGDTMPGSTSGASTGPAPGGAASPY